MSKVILTEEQKENWVSKDYNIGRVWAMDTVSTKDDPELKKLFDKLYNYEYFGDGDEVETELWTKILDYLELHETYDKYWEVGI